MARDCPDRLEYYTLNRRERILTFCRQRGANWRNDGPGGPPGPAAGRIGAGDAVDREYEVRNSHAKFPFNITNII